MKANNIFKYIGKSLLGVGVLTLAAACMTSCKDEVEDNGPVYFQFEDLPADYEFDFKGVDEGTFGNGKKFTIRAHGKWRFEIENEADLDWVKIWPMEGEDDGFIRFYCKENTMAQKRSAKYRLYLNDVEQEPFILTQGNALPNLEINTLGLTFQRQGGELSVAVTSNIDWNCSVEGVDAAYFTAERRDDKAVVKAEANTSGKELEATLVITGDGDFSNLRHEVSLTQLVAIFFDDFSWLKSKAGILGWETPVESETRIDKWSAEEKAHGYSSLSTWCYSRTGFIKLGKGKYGGDVAFPTIADLTEPTNVKVSLKAVGYGDKNSAKDPITMFYVALLGPGTITGAEGVDAATGLTIPYKKSASDPIINIPAVKFGLGENNWFLKNIDPTGLKVWTLDETNYSITVKGMDNTSRIVVVAGKAALDDAYSDPDGHTQRLFLDEFKVVQVK